MRWTDDLQTASWRGLPFGVQAEGATAGRAIAEHDYPYREKFPAWQEDTGRISRGFGLTGFLVGDDVAMKRRAMMNAADNFSGPGELVHPQLGSLQVTLMRFQCSTRADLGRVVELQFEFVEAGQQLYPESQADTQQQVADAGSDAQAAASTDYANRSAPAAAQTTTAGLTPASLLPPSNPALAASNPATVGASDLPSPGNLA